MLTDFELEKKVAFKAVITAAKLSVMVQHQINKDILNKTDRSPVTIADFCSQALICNDLHEAFPDDPIIAEEDSLSLQKPENKFLSDKTLHYINHFHPHVCREDLYNWINFGGYSDYSKRFWTLDPIDGTKGFLRGEQYAISLALIINGEIKVGALACPNLKSSTGDSSGTIFLAAKNEGVFEFSLNHTETKIPVSVSQLRDPKQARFCESVESAHSSFSDTETIAALLGITKSPVRLDSQAKYAAVARGEADIYFRLPTKKGYREKIWDHAGGCLIVSEAGGKVTDISGNPLDFTQGAELTKNKGVIVSNGHLHNSIIETIGKAKIQ